MRASLRTSAVVTTVMLLTGAAHAREPLLRADRVGSSLFVTFDLRPVDTRDLDVRLRGTDPVSVTWEIDVRRAVPFWVDRGVQSFALTATARATETPDVFELERTMNRRVVSAPVRVSRNEACAALTSFTNIELPYLAPVGADLRLRLTLRARVQGGSASTIVTQELARSTIE